MGSPGTAVVILEALLAGGHRVAAVVTRPERPAGRGRKPQPPPVKTAASRLGLDVLQPGSLKSERVAEDLRSRRPDAVVVVAYGRILPPSLLGLAPLGAINVHFSLLPLWRGAAPVQRCLEAGEERTGVSTMIMEEGLDTGPILLQQEVEVGPDETAPVLEDRLAERGAPLLLETLTGLENRALAPRPQDEARATWAPAVRKEEGLADWTLPPRRFYDRWRGFQPWPGIYASSATGKRLVLLEVRPAEGSCDAPGGTVLGAEAEAAVVACGGGKVLLRTVRPEGRRAMTGAAAIHGRILATGDRLRGRGPPAGGA